MKTKLSTLLLAITLWSGTIFASNTQVDGIWYEFDNYRLTAHVTYRGSSYDSYTNEYSRAVTIPSSVIYNDVTYSVTSIGKSAFRGCTGLTSVAIPNSVTSIGEYAFCGCTGLTSVAIPNSVTSIGEYAFSGCSSLTSMTIPDGVKSIGEYAFADCSRLVSVTIPNSLTSIGGGAFCRCTSLKTIEIPNSVTSIGNSVFWCCESLASVTIPNSVTSIENQAFGYCKGLTSVTIPNSVTSIGDQAFGNCTSLRSITVESANPPVLGDKVFDNVNTSNILLYVPTASITAYQAANQWKDFRISDITFVINGIRYCLYDSALTASVAYDGSYTGYIVIPSSVTYGNLSYSVTSIGEYAFQGCSSLTSVIIANSVTSIGKCAFEYCSGLTSIEIPNSVTSIGYSAFFGCSGLSSIVIPNSVTSIGGNAFNRCTGLTSVIIGNSVTNIEGGAFYGCTSLTSIEIPNSVTSIGFNAFGNCSSLTDIYVTCGDLLRVSQMLKNDSRVKYKPLPYSITANATNGNIRVPKSICDALELTATPNHGYHFTQWSDGITDNPRSFVLTQDTTFMAEFEKNKYSITTKSSNEEWGITTGDTSALYLEQVEISATANYGYHFVRWSDGNSNNPRTITITNNSIFTAIFATNLYTITDNSDSEKGHIEGVGSYDYLTKLTLTAIPNYGYHFVQWSDGYTNNTRTILLMQDITFIAEFAIDRTGTCGTDNALKWMYEDKSKTLTIDGVGELAENYTFGIEAPSNMQYLIIGNDVKAIGDSAFYAKNTLNHITIGCNVASIGNYAFAECKNFDDITCYATTVPTISDKTFHNIGNKQYIYLYVPEDRKRAYKRDTYWGLYDVQIIGAKSTETTTVAVTPTGTAAEITWPMVSNAATYELVIKDASGKVICTLTFNAQGQLTNIAFNAPARNNESQQTQSTGFAFTVTGLEPGTQYSYSIVAKNASGTTLNTETGTFTTKVLDALENTAVTNGNSIKLLRNGQVLILRGDKTYTVTGQEVK